MDPPFSRQAPSQEQLDQTNKQREVVARAGTLLSSSDFRWFIEEAIEKPMKAAQQDALSITKTQAECEIARHVAHHLRELSTWLDVRLKVARVHIKSLDTEAQP